MKTKPKLTLVGSGPGDPDLITLKGIKAIKNAEVILYDSLAPLELLNYTSESCVKVFAGKRMGKPSIRQQKINELIVSYAKTHQNIVRLKGGDPMVFGRSFEEIETAKKAGIEVEIIPGISSFSAFASAYQAPITKRKACYGFWVISATTHLLELSNEIKIAAQSSSTVIIFMGLNKLSDIVNEFLQHKEKEYPIGLFQAIGTDEETCVIGTLENIVALKEKNNIITPTLIVVGNAVNYIDKQLLESLE